MSVCCMWDMRGMIYKHGTETKTPIPNPPHVSLLRCSPLANVLVIYVDFKTLVGSIDGMDRSP